MNRGEGNRSRRLEGAWAGRIPGADTAWGWENKAGGRDEPGGGHRTLAHQDGAYSVLSVRHGSLIAEPRR